MADDKRGREKQARNADRRQRRRDLDEALERGDEPEPPIDADDLADLDLELESVAFPATGAEVVAAIGGYEIAADDEIYTVEELVPETDESYDSPSMLRVWVQRPTVAATMKRVLEAVESLPNADLRGSQRDAYEKTFRELKAVAPDDDDEGIRIIGDWIVEQIRNEEQIPGSRAVRREAAAFCRTNGYEIRNDEWLGI